MYYISTGSDAGVIIDRHPDQESASSSQTPTPSYRLGRGKPAHTATLLSAAFIKTVPSRRSGGRHYQLIHSITAPPRVQCTSCLGVTIWGRGGTTCLSIQFVPVHNHTYKQSRSGVQPCVQPSVLCGRKLELLD